MKGKIFNAQEVQSILNRSKVMFREVIKPLVSSNINPVNLEVCNTWQWATKESRRECPYQVGQKIFCKESFVVADGYVFYSEAHFTKGFLKSHPWQPAQHMKQEHSRLTLLIKEIKVGKLADITPFDCVCEGIWDGRNVALGMSGKAVEAFKDYWNATHKKPEEKFEASPWVWCVNFEVINN